MTNVKILTLNWEGKDKLEKLAPSLINSLNNYTWSWYIKDNNSKDDSINYLNSLNNPNIKVIQYPNNQQNFSQGCNYLFNLANPDDEDYILLLNNDVVFNDTTSIDKMISLMEKDKDIGIVGARLLYTGTNKLQHAGVVFVPTWQTPTHFRANQVSDNNAFLNREFQAITGAVLLTKAKYYRTADIKSGLDENLVWAFDDINYCLAVKYNLNKKIIYCGETNIFHEESFSLKKNPVNKLFLNNNIKYFLNKWKGRYSIDIQNYNNPKYKIYKSITND